MQSELPSQDTASTARVPGQPPPQLLSRYQNQGRGSRQLLRRLALVPCNLFPTSSCVGGGGTSPASPHASHQPSTRPHSLLVCVVKSSRYSSLESVNSSVPCLLLLPRGCQGCCPLPQWIPLPSCFTHSAGKTTHHLPRGSVLGGAIPASRVWVTWHGMAAVPGLI